MTEQTQRLGFLVNDLGPSQSSFFIIQSINEWVSKSRFNDAAVFCRNGRPPCSHPQFPIFSLADFPGYVGVAVATSFECADFLRQTQGPRHRVYYSQDLEWTRRAGRYEDWYAVYGDTSLQMLARCRDHAAIMQVAWNRPFQVIPDFDISQILEAVCPPG